MLGYLPDYFHSVIERNGRLSAPPAGQAKIIREPTFSGLRLGKLVTITRIFRIDSQGLSFEVTRHYLQSAWVTGICGNCVRAVGSCAGSRGCTGMDRRN